MRIRERKCTQFLALTFCFFLLAACATKKSGQGTHSFEFQRTFEPFAGMKVSHYRHQKSQLDLLVLPQEKSGVAAFVTAYKVGSRYETQGRTGLAHLFEHMMFRGTKSYPEPFKTLSAWGGHYNAFTTQDVTVYHELVPKALFEDVANFEAERMRELKITSEGFNQERGAVVSERKMRTEDSPMGRMYWEIHQLAYDVHPYKTGPIGWQEDLDATSFEDALAFYKRFYAPNRAVVAISGDVSTEEALDVMEKKFGHMSAESWIEPSLNPEPNTTTRAFRRKVVPMKAESVYFAEAFFGPTYKDPVRKIAASSLMCTLWGDAKFGWLGKELVEKGIAKTTYASCGADMDPGLAMTVIVGNPGVSVEQIEKAYDQAKKGFLSWAKNKADNLKKYYLLEHWSGLREPINLAQQLASDFAQAGSPSYSFDFIDLVKDITFDEIAYEFRAWTRPQGKGLSRMIIQPAKATANLKRESAKNK